MLTQLTQVIMAIPDLETCRGFYGKALSRRRRRSSARSSVLRPSSRLPWVCTAGANHLNPEGV